jgi:ribonuclease J
VRITVHRGSHQIGGTCIEIASGSARIVLDAGLPLDADPQGKNLPPPVAGLFDREGPSVDGLFLSHAHADHSGLIAASRAQVPVWMSEGTSKMILAGSLFARQPSVPKARRKILVAGQAMRVGPFRVTAYPVDHSVYDAMAFLVEVEGRRVLYTGDLRFHGRKPGMARELARIVQKAPLDALLIEGTRLGGRANEANLSEKELEKQLVADFKAAPGIVLGMYSPLNVDRFVTYFRAARRSGRTFVIDSYQAFVLHLIGRKTKVPMPGAVPDLRLWVPPSYSASVASRRLGHTDWAKRLGKGAITAEEINRDPERYVVLFRQSMQKGLFGNNLPPCVSCVFSYWPGYLKELRTQALLAEVYAAGGNLLQRHASGHAHPDDLRRFAEELNPRLLIPVHTTSPETWARWRSATKLMDDGQPITV